MVQLSLELRSFYLFIFKDSVYEYIRLDGLEGGGFVELIPADIIHLGMVVYGYERKVKQSKRYTVCTKRKFTLRNQVLKSKGD